MLIFKIASKLRRQKGEVVQVQISEKIEVVQCSLNHVMLFPYLISQLVLEKANKTEVRADPTYQRY